MRLPVLAAILYGATALFANADALSPEAREEVMELRGEALSKLVFHAEAKELREVAFLDANGGRATLNDFEGQVTVVNLWATWCPPCRKEMPALDNLKAELEGSGADVVVINIERNGLKKAHNFFKQIGIEHLAVHSDEDNAVPRSVGVLGFPVTLILDPQGREIARLQGDAVWDAPEAIALVKRLAALMPGEDA